MPDACSLAKGIGGGFPLGAMAVTERLAQGLPPGSHASTFGGNPLACAAGVANIEVYRDENLIENAIKHMGNQKEPVIEIGLRDQTDGTVYYVKDNGTGIEKEYHEKIFGLFEKLNPTNEGTGIGLALVKRIVETHGGKIWVESEGLGKGSTFCFTIPDKRNP